MRYRDKRIAREIYLEPTITASFDCFYCGQKIDIKSNSRGAYDVVGCTNCDMSYEFSTPELCVEISHVLIDMGEVVDDKESS